MSIFGNERSQELAAMRNREHIENHVRTIEQQILDALLRIEMLLGPKPMVIPAENVGPLPSMQTPAERERKGLPPHEKPPLGKGNRRNPREL